MLHRDVDEIARHGGHVLRIVAHRDVAGPALEVIAQAASVVQMGVAEPDTEQGVLTVQQW